MPIIQISKIQQRSGNLVDLPQLDEAQFGFAADAKRVFIGKTSGNSENIEVLTSYSNISFSQVLGSDGGNFNISNAQNGQILTFVETTNTWENWPNEDVITANADFKVDLGDVAYIKMTGNAGAGFVLETDGLGNLSWTPKGVVVSAIEDITSDTTAVVTTQTDHYLTDAASITITDVAATGTGNNFTKLNGGSFYANVLTSNTFSLYSDSALTTPVDTSTGGGNTQVYTANSGQIVSAVGGSGSTLVAAGANSQLQYNLSGTLAGTSMLTYGGTGTLTHSGPAIVAGNVYANSGTIGANILSANTLTVTANANIGNIGTAGLITATGNIRGGNLVTGGVLSVTGNANIGNIGTAGLITATGNITGGNIITSGLLTVTGNANIGNIGTAGLITATGNITGGNLITAGVVTAVGNANVGNLGTAGVFATTLSATANANVGNIGTAGLITATGNITGGNISTSGLFTATGNITGGNIVTAGQLVSSVATGTAPLVITSTTQVANLSVATAGSATTAGTVTTAAQPNITSVSSSFTSLTFVDAQTISGNNMTITTGSSTNLGTITGNWSLSSGSKLQATYADLAEYYEADQHYEPGTVLAFGGDREVTIAEDGTTRVAGVVSTDPAYAMNAKCPGIAVAIALQGRVPTKVRGTVRKGDMMVSAGNGFARPWNNPQMGTVIGKALENFDGVEGVIEIAVGRL